MARKKRNLQLDDNALAVHIVLDASGSMNSIKTDAIGSINEYLASLAKDSPASRVGLTLFGAVGVVTTMRDHPVDAVEPLTDISYQPRGGTPLYDAIAEGVAILDATSMPNKALVILTDGEENASRTATKESVRALLEDRQEHNKWLVIYLGANQDAFAAGGAISTQANQTMTFNASGAGLRGTVAAAYASTMRYAVSGDLQAAAFTADERDAAAADSDEGVRE